MIFLISLVILVNLFFMIRTSFRFLYLVSLKYRLGLKIQKCCRSCSEEKGKMIATEKEKEEYMMEMMRSIVRDKPNVLNVAREKSEGTDDDSSGDAAVADTCGNENTQNLGSSLSDTPRWS